MSSERTGNCPAAHKGDWSGAETQLIPTGIPAEKELFRFRFYYLKSPHYEIAEKTTCGHLTETFAFSVGDVPA